MENFKDSLKNEIVKNSINKDFEQCIYEWELYKLRYVNIKGFDCICNHRNIKRLCFIKNKYNKKILLLGSDCIKRFFNHIEVEFYFNGIERLRKLKIPNPKFIDYCKNKFLINEWEYIFFTNLFGKRKFTAKQLKFRYELTAKLYNKLLNQNINKKQWALNCEKHQKENPEN